MWEVVGTPIEAFSGGKFTVTVEYDQDDNVTKVSTTDGHSAF
jgi:YD repeat-containing protein